MTTDATTQTTDAAASTAPDTAGDWLGGTEASEGTTPPDAGQATETPPQEGADGADQTATDSDDAADGEGAGAPEAYEDFTLPDGMDMDQESLAQFTETAKGLDLDQAKAQQLIDLAAQHTERVVAKQGEAWAAQRAEWREQAKADEEIGGRNADASRAAAKRAMDRYGDDDLKSFLRDTGFGDHPGLLRAFARMGKAIAEDSIETSGQQGTSRPLASAFFPNSDMKD